MGIYKDILSILRNQPDSIEIFGDTGTGKTIFAMEIVKDALSLGKKVLIIDTEKNYIEIPEDADYVYISNFWKVYSYIRENLFRQEILEFQAVNPETEEVVTQKKEIWSPKQDTHYDVIVLDSLGLSILGEFAQLNMKERGNILLQAETIAYFFKQYSQVHNCLVITINQPTSEMNIKQKRPFGDKSKFFFKEIWETQKILASPKSTKIRIISYRSRYFGDKTIIFNMKIEDSGDLYPKVTIGKVV